VTIFRIHGPFLFGATDKIGEALSNAKDLPPIVILRLRNMTAIDGTGLLALEDLAETLHASNRHLILCGAREQPERLMLRSGFANKIGEENICRNIESALSRARQLYQAGETQRQATQV
jgi:SulP family sulfate permease